MHSTHATTLKADCEFSCLQEISGLSRSVLNCLARQKQGIHVVTRSDVPALKTRHPRGDIIRVCSDVSHLRVQKDVGTCTFIQQYPSIRRKTGLHLTRNSTPQPKVLMVANIFDPSSNGSDGCCTNHNGHRNKFQMSRSGPKTTPTNHGPREKQSDKEQRSPHKFIQNINLPDKAAGRIIEFSNDF